MASGKKGSALMILIGLSKLGEAAFLIAVALGLGHVLRHGVQDTLLEWTRAVRVDPDNRFVHKLVGSATGMSRARMQALRLGTMLYGGLFLAEGVGLLLRKRWAEYVTVISTAGFLPIEGYELVHRFSAAKSVVTVLNVVVVVYLIAQLVRGGRESGNSD
jgi:uncharacterized membrane protein (DUF2068 family)